MREGKSTNLRHNASWGGRTCTLLSQVYDLPQSPGWVPNYTERSLSSQCCLVYRVGRKSPEEMQNNILINSILDPLFLKVINDVNSETWE